MASLLFSNFEASFKTMELITQEEAKRLRVQKLGKKHPVRAMIEILEPGQQLKINREEMRWKKFTPSFFCNQIKKTTGKTFTVYKIPVNKGWVVKREG